MFELTFLGTAASVPLIKRGLSSAVVAHDEYRMMVDCGEGTQRQVLMSGLGFRRLEHIFITHSHLDHILGLGGMLSTLGQWESVERLTIYAGATACEKIADLVTKVVFRGARPPVAIEMKPVQPGIVLKTEDFDVVAFPVRHRGPDCFGYVFQEHARRPFLNDKATELGVPLGPERKTLIAGKPITLSDGRIVQPNDVLGELQRGSKLVMTGDTGDTESLIKICKDADVLVTEATYLAEDIGLARDYGHSTAAEAATLAKNAGVGQLVLTHISGRYPENVIEAEARAIFPNTVVARDFDKFKIRAA
ncbi:MAG TPA: ribonuclease Z [Thermoflexales bacterium]|nr:ribonuclease Z [Thermoflexales bacterium]